MNKFHVSAPSSPVSTSASSSDTEDASPINYSTITCDALVLGCGVAGNAAALRLANRGVHVTMLSAADDPLDCATYWAQGGIIYKSEDDTPALLAQDVHRAGAGVCDADAVDKLTLEGPRRVEEMLLEVSKVPFARDANGELALTLEASHNRARILYKADHTGRVIAESMIRAVREHPLISLVMARSAFELVTNDRGQCLGALTVSSSPSSSMGDEIEFYRAPYTLLATGGLGDLYQNTSNPAGARGEGVALAARAGAQLKNMQYVQFHPTTLCIPNERRFLLTEALRGEGAILRDRHGRAFAKDYHPDGELAPRDVVARTILAEMAKQGEPCMFLDISHEPAEWLQTRFPTIYEHCLARGIDLTKQAMPVVPAAHYHCGGVEVDLDGCTTVPGLYAAGEVSCTGLHGANRLASTSLLEGLVWGCASADHFLANQRADSLTNDHATNVEDRIAQLLAEPSRRATDKELAQLLHDTQLVMWEKVGPLRTVTRMTQAVEELSALERKAEAMHRACVVTRQSAGVRNAVRAAKEVAIAALASRRSVGTHYIVPEPESAVVGS